MGRTVTIVAPSPTAAQQLAESLANPANALDVATSANNTVEVYLDDDTDAALGERKGSASQLISSHHATTSAH